MRHIITITPVLNGYVVEVGCVRLVYKQCSEDPRQMGIHLEAYLEDPEKTQHKFFQMYNAQVPMMPNFPPPAMQESALPPTFDGLR